MLDAFTSSMCEDPWGRISFARALVEINADFVLKHEVSMTIPLEDGAGHTRECPKRVINLETPSENFNESVIPTNSDGFTKGTLKGANVDNPSKVVNTVNDPSTSNSFDALNNIEEGVSSSRNIQEDDHETGPKASQWNEDVESDNEVDEFIFPEGDKFGDKFDIRLKEKNDKNIKSNEVVNKNVVESSELKAVEPIDSVDKEKKWRTEWMISQLGVGKRRSLEGKRRQNIGRLKYVNALNDQGSDANVMPLSIYNRLTNEKLVGTDIRLSLASHSYIYPLGIAEDVLIDIAGYVYPESNEQDIKKRAGNDAHVDDADIRPIYNEEPMAEVQTTAEINIFATGQQHIEQPEFNNEGEVDQNAEQCHDIRPLPAKLTDNMTTELSDQSLESKNVCLKKTVAQFQKDFLRMEAHCVNLELKYQNQALKEGQHGQFSKVKSNEAKVKHDIDVIETLNIELEHSEAKLLAENEQLHKEKEHLKQTYKDLFDSIKRTRVQTIDQNDSLMAQLNKKSNENADVLAQI
ncbi:hypothetical protein Tco_0009358 [Tanacetum coccineum]